MELAKHATKMAARFLQHEEEIRLMVRAGGGTRSVLALYIDDMVCMRSIPASWGPALQEILDQEWAANAARKRPEPCTNEAIDAAFEELERVGIPARQDAGEDEEDAWSLFEPFEKWVVRGGAPPRGACFYDAKAMMRAVKGQPLVLCFGAFALGREAIDADHVAVGDTVVEVLRRHGLDPTWDGTATGRIELPPFEWYRPSLPEDEDEDENDE